MKTSWIMLPLVLAAAMATADDASPSKEAIAAKLNEIGVAVAADDIVESPVDGLYQITVGTAVAYVTTDGDYVIEGDVIELDGLRNLTQRKRDNLRAEILADVDPSEMIVFTPTNGEIKHRITVFTDVDCVYCQRLHREIAQINALGIEVRYLAYPRSGPNRNLESWERSVSVWCADNRNAALTRAKRGDRVPSAECDAPVAEHYALGERVGVRGTPAIFAENGTQVGGYLEPEELAARLEQVAD